MSDLTFALDGPLGSPSSWAFDSFKNYFTLGVYAIWNPIEEKCYIGSSVEVANRWKTHLRMLNNGRHHSSKLQSAWDKFDGYNNFKFYVMEYCSYDLFTIETSWIKRLDSYHNGYNMTPVAFVFSLEWLLEFNRSTETRKMRSDKMNELWQDPEYREMMIESGKRKFEDPEYIKYISENRRRLYAEGKLVINDRQRESSRNTMNRLWKDSEFLIKVNKMIEKRNVDPSFRKMLSDRMLRLHAEGKLHTPEWFANIAKRLTELNKTPEKRKESSERLKEFWKDSDWAEQNAKASGERLKNKWEDLEFVKRHKQRSAAQFAEFNKLPERREKSREIMNGLWQDSAFAVKVIASTKKAHKARFEERMGMLSQYKEMILGWRNDGMLFREIVLKLNDMGDEYLYIDNGLKRTKWNFGNVSRMVKYWSSV